MDKPKQGGLSISVRSYMTSFAVVLALMIAAYAITLFVPGGTYARVENAQGNLIIDTAGGFTPVDGGISFGRWLLSPLLVLGAPGSGTLIAVIVFLLVIGGIFTALDRSGLMTYMLHQISSRFCTVRYRLMAVVMLFFMALGAMIGSFEECIPLVPIVVTLSINLGWDALTGMGMSLLAVGCGFASGVCNPFTVGVAQQLVGLPMFSGASMRLVSFALIYALLLFFVRSYARRIERPLSDVSAVGSFVRDARMDRGVKSFASILASGIALVLCSGLIPALQSLTMVIVAITFLAAGVSACVLCGMGAKPFLRAARDGVVSILPAVVMILLASSIRFTLDEAHVLDTLLHGAVRVAGHMPRFAVILFIYLIVLAMNFFIPSGSAKAFMLIPLIVPMAQVFGVSAQLCILAFAFGDGFSNVFYPTNPALLISLGLADVSYPAWMKWSWKFQALNLLLTSLLLLLGLALGY